MCLLVRNNFPGLLVANYWLISQKAVWRRLRIVMLWVIRGSNSNWEAFLDPAIESSPGDAKYDAAVKTESKLVPIKCTGWREMPDSHPSDASLERSPNLLPFYSKPGGLVLWWALVLLTTTPVLVWSSSTELYRGCANSETRTVCGISWVSLDWKSTPFHLPKSLS